jgi:hypothetical protein
MAGALGGDEPQHVRCDNLIWLLGNHTPKNTLRS